MLDMCTSLHAPSIGSESLTILPRHVHEASERRRYDIVTTGSGIQSKVQFATTSSSSSSESCFLLCFFGWWVWSSRSCILSVFLTSKYRSVLDSGLWLSPVSLDLPFSCPCTSYAPDCQSVPGLKDLHLYSVHPIRLRLMNSVLSEWY